jgi:hypothetical protein
MTTFDAAFAIANMTALPRDDSSTTPPMPGKIQSAGLSTGAKAGIGVAAAMAVLMILAAILFWLMRRRRRSKTISGSYDDVQKDPTRAAQEIQCSRTPELAESQPRRLVNNPLAENPPSDNHPPETLLHDDYDVGHNSILNEPISDLTLLEDDLPVELLPPPDDSSDLDGGLDDLTMGKPSGRDLQSNGAATPLNMTPATQHRNAATTDPIKSYGSDATAVDVDLPASRATSKDSDPKCVLGLDDRDFLDRLPYLEGEYNEPHPMLFLTATLAAQSSNDRQISSATAIGMSPFAFEYRPNPVIFPHLAAVPENNVVTDGQIGETKSTKTVKAKDLRLNQATRTKMLDGLDTLEPLTQLLRYDVPSAAPEHLKSPHRTSFEQSISNTGSGSHGPDPRPEIRRARYDQDSTSFVPLSGQGGCAINNRYKGTAPTIPDIESSQSSLAFEINSFAVASTKWEDISPECGIDSAERNLPTYLDQAYPIPAYLGSNTVRLSTDSEQTSPTTWHSSPGSVSTAPSSHSEHTCAAKSPSPKLDVPVPSMSPVSVLYAAAPEYPCPARDCHLVFRTPGQRNNHYNRKHNLRFVCTLSVCNATFGLRADLERHKRTVHGEGSKPGGGQVFKCTNVGCTTPDKTYNRRDNFNRHVQRCCRVIQRRHAKERPV